jgi:tetratricopeptide (TPR) repeat protein
MARPAWAIRTFCLISLLFVSVNQAALSEATNKPSNAKAQQELVLIAECWDRAKPQTYDRATTAYESVRRDYPATLEAELAYVEILRIRWLKGEQEAVLQGYKQWLSSEPSPIAQGHALAYLADYARGSQEYAKAEQLYKQAIALAGNHIAAGLAALDLAEMYLGKVNRPSEAFALFKETAEKFSGTPIEGGARRRWARAVSDYAGMKFPQANDQVRAVLQPVAESTADAVSLAHARYNLAEVLIVMSRPAEALPVLERAAAYVDRYKDQPWAADCLSLVIILQRKLNRSDDAIASARRYVELFPHLERARYAQLEIGELLESQGKWHDAISAYREIIQRWPESNVARHAALRIAICEQAKSRVNPLNQ